MTEDEQKAFVEMATKYKNVFHTMEGQSVLKHIIFNILGTFRTDKESEGDMALSNAGAGILNYVSCSDADVTAGIIIRSVIDAPAITIK